MGAHVRGQPPRFSNPSGLFRISLRPRPSPSRRPSASRRAAACGACYTRLVRFPKTKLGRGALGALGGAVAFIAIGQLYALVGST